MALIGRTLELENLRFCLCLCLGFWGMLRTGELFELRLHHLLLKGNTLVVRLGDTKTGVRRQVDENVVVQHPGTVAICRTVLELFGRTQSKLWNRSTPDFKTQFKLLLKFFHLPRSFRPYSLRRGGATEDFRQHGLMERSLLRGRWGSSGAARQYIQEGLSMLTKLSLSPPSQALLAHYALLFDPL